MNVVQMNWTEFPLNLIEILANGNKIKRIGILGEEGGDGGEKEFDGGTEENGRMLKRLEVVFCGNEGRGRGKMGNL
jgi:hypothetical protein